MGHIQVIVHIAEAKRQLLVDVKLVGSEATALRNMELIQHRCNLLAIQQIQGGRIVSVCRVGFPGVFFQSVVESAGIHRLVLDVQAGIDDGNSCARTGIAGLPGHIGAGHLCRDRHVGLCRSTGNGFLRLIARLQDHLLHTRNLFDFGDLAVFHVRGNGIGRQGQVPADIQLLANGALNGGGQLLLRRFQAVLIGHGRGVLCNVHGGIAHP